MCARTCVFEQRSTGQRRVKSTSLKQSVDGGGGAVPFFKIHSIARLFSYSPYADMLLASAQARAHGYR